MSDPVSRALFERARRVIPGGVNSPVRAFRAVGGEPVFVRSASGAWIEGADGRRYVDLVCSWGALILGHAHPAVVEAVERAVRRGSSYGAPTEAEIELAERIGWRMPSVPMSRLVSSGTEAVMGALRLARGATSRDLVVKTEGCYHGGADYLLVRSGSGLATAGQPDSAGVPAAIAGTTLVVPYNDVEAVASVFERHGERIAAVIVEPVAGNMGVVPPEPGWLEALRAQCDRHGALLVFDEVITGFRIAPGGAQQRFGVRADLTTLGKILGGGFPLGAYGGAQQLMERVAPVGPVYQAGTLSGNPVAVAAGLATLEVLGAPGTYEELERKGARLEQSLREGAARAGVEVCVQRVGSMLTVFFTPDPVRRWSDADRSDRAAFARWHRALLEREVYWPPSQFEAAFVSLAHDETALSRVEQAACEAFAAVAESRASSDSRPA
ncbi:MAG: glutamate-1-semialdehyde 2,1-aminomutase [Myxococcales bacterium]|nr:glutamate-1-semialdehyde 2,1-aminomutase [Myxococcales bacterium]